VIDLVKISHIKSS